MREPATIEERRRAIRILLVEDNPADVRLTREALRDCKIRNAIRVADDGVVALEVLRRQGPYRDEPLPDLILLDLNLPRKDGREVLAEIKQDPALRHIPTVILTTSRADEDVLRSYQLQANAYVSKPVGLKEFMHVVRCVEQFWLEVVRLP